MGSPTVSSEADISVLGAGPAALALAIWCRDLGLETVVIAPSPAARWKQSYGAFTNSLGQEGIGGFSVRSSLRSIHTRPIVLLDGGVRMPLEAPYARFDTAHLQDGLLAAARAVGVRLVDAKAEEVSASAGAKHPTNVLTTRGKVEARFVFDASGSNSRFTRRSRKAPLGYQSAFGRWLEVDELPCCPEEMWLMNYRSLDAIQPPSFLYVIPESSSTLFVQETVLASRLPIDMSVLSARLDQRLARLGLRIKERRAEERCIIPLGVGLPMQDDGVIAFGAAAGFVNPVSGYQLGRALERSEHVARAVAQGASHRAVRDAVWPSSSRRAFGLYHAALENMLRLPSSEFRHFIQGFFSLPEALWLGFMTGRQAPTEVLKTMWRLFGRAPNSLRLELVRGSAELGLAALRPSRLVGGS